MRSYKEVLRFLIIREQLLQGWKIGFLIVCAALLFLSLTLSHVKIEIVEVRGTVLKRSIDGREEKLGNYLLVQLDNGETVRASALRKIDYLPGRRVVLKETTTNFFGLRKFEFKSYATESNPE